MKPNMWSIKARQGFEFWFLYMYIYIYIYILYVILHFFFFFGNFCRFYFFAHYKLWSQKHYWNPFHVENVNNFIEFVVECGWIWLQKLIAQVKISYIIISSNFILYISLTLIIIIIITTTTTLCYVSTKSK